MRKTNFHTHTHLCKHADGTEEDYVNEALRQRLDVLGFSDHAPYPDDRYGLRMDYRELAPHISKLQNLKRSLRDKLEIRIGLEIEYDPFWTEYYKSLLREGGVEYFLLGQHIYIDKQGQPVNVYFIEQERDTSSYIDYANSIKAGMESGLFRAIAHPDLMFINKLPYDENGEKACSIIIQAAKDTGTILEFNANGFRRKKDNFPGGEFRYPYPYKPFWEMAAKQNIPVIVSSDCHEPRILWDTKMKLAHRMAKELHLHVVDHIFS